MANGGMQGMGMMVSPNTQTTKMPMQEKINTAIVDGSQFREAVANLSAESSDVLEQHLTPRVKEAMAELFGPEVIEVLKDFGPTEPTVNIPVSVVSQAYPAKTIVLATPSTGIPASNIIRIFITLSFVNILLL